MILLALIIGSVALCPAPVMAAWSGQDPICSMSDDEIDPLLKEEAGCVPDPADKETIFDKVPGAVTAVFSVVGIVAVGMIIFGGIRYSISRGDPGKLKLAKDTIMYALIGLVVTLLAFSIVTFVLNGIS